MTRVLLLVLGLLAPLVAHAVPFHLTNQGRLVDDETGLGLEGLHELTFSLYPDAAAAGESLWRETVEVDLVDGSYSVVLGLESPLSQELLDQYPLYLGLSVDGAPEMTPRYEISSVPYAIQAERSITAGHAATAVSAETATHLEGGTVDATSLSIDGQTVIDADGSWAAEPPPPADLGCDDGQLQAWNAETGAWECFELPPIARALDCEDGEHPVFDGTEDAWSCGAESDPRFAASPARGITDADIAAWNAVADDLATHGSHADAGYLNSYTETDPHFADHPASDITADHLEAWNDAAQQVEADRFQEGAGLRRDTSTDPDTLRVERSTIEAWADGVDDDTRYDAGSGLRLDTGVDPHRFSVEPGVTAGSEAGAEALQLLEYKGGAQGRTELYYFALEVPNSTYQRTPANGMALCSPATDDNEPGPWGTSHSTDHEPAYIVGFSSDVNGHCLAGHSGWSSNGRCVGILVTNWSPSSHEGFGAWCRQSTGSNGSIAWAQINVASSQYWTSTGVSEGISKPASPGDITCTSSGRACIKRLK